MLKTNSLNQPQKTAFVLLAAIFILPVFSAPIALLAGAMFSLFFGNPWPNKSANWSKKLLQLSVVGLGFSLSLSEVWTTGKAAIPWTFTGIVLTMVTGHFLGRWYATSSGVGTLVSFGTAICGGSAIAAMAPIIKSKDEETAVALATIFTLNSLALILFPVIGHGINLSQEQFGLWAALAIHDTSSVVGATSAFGSESLSVGTTVKLARAVWIIPCAFGISWMLGEKGKTQYPLFIFGFLIAAGIRSLLPQFDSLWLHLTALSRQALVLTLFLVGAGLTKEVITKVGLRPLAQGLTLWLFVSVISLGAILNGWVH